MKPDRQRNLQDLLVFCLLIAIGVAGRWGQPQWCFTPTAAAAIFAGWYFSRIAVAAMVPLSILAISDLLLPAYNNVAVLLATYVVMTVPVLLGRLQRNSQSRAASAFRWALFAFVPATLFYIVTNFAVWKFQSTYEKSLAGLAECYWAAVPFYRWMLTGDIFYLTVMLTCCMLAGVPTLLTQRTKLVAK
jgi:hypothetical protein